VHLVMACEHRCSGKNGRRGDEATRGTVSVDGKLLERRSGTSENEVHVTGGGLGHRCARSGGRRRRAGRRPWCRCGRRVGTVAAACCKECNAEDRSTTELEQITAIRRRYAEQCRLVVGAHLLVTD